MMPSSSSFSHGSPGNVFFAVSKARYVACQSVPVRITGRSGEDGATEVWAALHEDSSKTHKDKIVKPFRFILFNRFPSPDGFGQDYKDVNFLNYASTTGFFHPVPGMRSVNRRPSRRGFRVLTTPRVKRQDGWMTKLGKGGEGKIKKQAFTFSS